MSFTFNGATPATVTFNGNDVRKVTLNGVTVWEKSGALTLGGLQIGTVVMVEETSGNQPWIVIARDHHGEGLTTLVRQYSDIYSRYHYSAPSSAYSNKYSASTLKQEMSNFYNDYLTTETQAKIQSVEIPIRQSANSSTDQDYATSNLFPLSEIEITNGGNSLEGTYISYFDSAEKRICYTSSGTAVMYWTRSVLGGMSNYARVINTSGTITNNGVSNNAYIRPACCVLSSAEITQDSDGVYYL